MHLQEDLDEQVQVLPKLLVLFRAAPDGVTSAAEGSAQLNGELTDGDDIAETSKRQRSLHWSGRLMRSS